VVRGDLTPEFRARFTKALLELNFDALTPATRQFFHKTVLAYRFVPADDGTYASVRDVVEALHLTPASVR
jgi:ABC-type phosphate/phosphonate transport system substrate-binding protein